LGWFYITTVPPFAGIRTHFTVLVFGALYLIFIWEAHAITVHIVMGAAVVYGHTDRSRAVFAEGAIGIKGAILAFGVAGADVAVPTAFTLLTDAIVAELSIGAIAVSSTFHLAAFTVVGDFHACAFRITGIGVGHVVVTADRFSILVAFAGQAAG